MRVLITRPLAQGEPWVRRLREWGIDALALPMLAIEAVADPEPLHAAWQALPRAALAMFVSANAVEQFFARRPQALAWPAGTLAGATGPGTVQALLEAGVPAALIRQPPAGGPFDSEALWSVIGSEAWAGRAVAVVRGEQGRDWLAERLGAAGAQVHFVAAYRRVAPRPSAERTALLEAAVLVPAGHLWHFSSSEAVQQLFREHPALAAVSGRMLALATHPRIAARARELGVSGVEAIGPQLHDLVQRVRSIKSGCL